MSEKSAHQLDHELAQQLIAERGPTLASIFLVAEIDRRKTFVEQGFGSTWDYLRRVHQQSDTMIHYRLSCARAVNRFPQVIEPLRDGRLCMTTLAKLMEVMNEANCDALLAEAMGKSVSHARRLVARERPKPVPKDVTTPLVSIPVAPQTRPPAPAAEQRVQTEILTESLARKHITVDAEYDDLLKRARGALSHKMPGAAELDILKEGLRQLIKQSEKRKGIVERPLPDKVATDGDISQSCRRTVWKRDRGCCQWRTEDGGICGSAHRVQFHHRQDRAKGGLGSPENVVLLCQTHHLLATEIAWGEELVSQFRRGPKNEAAHARPSQLDFPDGS